MKKQCNFRRWWIKYCGCLLSQIVLINAFLSRSIDPNYRLKLTTNLQSSWFQNTISSSNNNDIETILKELFDGHDTTSGTSKRLGFLFVSNDWPLQEIATTAMDLLGNDGKMDLVTIVGGGVIGSGQEIEENGSMSFLSGPCDDCEIFLCNNKDVFLPKLKPKTSVLLFSDPYCNQLHTLFGKLQDLDCITAGGITAPSKETYPSLAWNGRILESGSLVGITLPKSIGLQCVVSQGGCHPVGPTFEVTRVEGPAVHELDETRALDQLEASIEQASSKDQELVRNMGVLGGVYYNKQNKVPKTNEEKKLEETCDKDAFMVRQVTGFRPRSGSILVCGQPQIQPGDFFRFHVRSVDLALDEWKLILERAQTERLFLGKTNTPILAALQISSLARGQDFFSKPNVDLHFAKRLLSSSSQNTTSTPIGGFFANAEIGPVGIRMGAQADHTQNHLHGFATVVAILCDYSNTTTSSADFDTTLSSSSNSTSVLTSWE